MSVQILYNGVDNFSGISNIPLFGRSQQYIQYGERWGAIDNITLEGVITGECGHFTGLVTGQRELINRFGQDYKSLEIYENGDLVYEYPYCEIRNISFSPSQYVGVLPYTIDIISYPEKFFSGTYGVLNPENTWSINENEDGTLNITHSVTAQGFNTSSNYTNALNNARAYVQARTGWNDDFTPAFIDACSGLNPCLQTQEELVNRFDGTYAVTESYIADPRWDSGILTYSIGVSSGLQNGITQVSVQGSVNGCKNADISYARNRYNTFDIFSAAVDAYSGFAGNIQLNPEYISSGINENPFAKNLSFDVLFDNDESPSVFLDYNISYNTDYLKDVTRTDFRGAIRGRGDLATRWNRVQEYYSGFDFREFVENKYNEQNFGYPLNKAYISSGITRNSFDGVISVNLSFDNREPAPSGLERFEYDISFDPAIHQYSSKGLIYGTGQNYEYDVQDLGYATRARLRINGSATADEGHTREQAISIVNDELNYLSALYLQGNRKVLEENNISQNNEGNNKSFTFSTAWSAENPEFSLPI